MQKSRLAIALGILTVGALGAPACEETEIPDNSGAFTPAPALELSLDQDSLAFSSIRADEGASSSLDITVQNLSGQDATLRGFYLEGASENYWIDICDRPAATDPCETPAPSGAESSCSATIPANGSLSLPVVFTPTLQETTEACESRDGTITLVFLSSLTTELSFTVSGIGDSDSDGDGALCSAGDDCDDTDPAVFTGNDEICDGKDNDCDGDVPEDEANSDRDQFRVCAGDCDDDSRDVYPGAPEICDEVDNDCDGSADDTGDEDGDGVPVCNDDGETDCDDADSGNFPGNTESCDGLDNDCDGDPADDEVDEDGDGILACDGDTDDGDVPEETPTEPLCP